MASQTVSDQAFVTLATNDTYSLGALVLAHSLRQAGTNRQIAIMITAGVSPGMRQQLSTVFDVIVEVNVLDSRDTTNLALLTRPDLGVTFTKLHCWRLTQFTKCVFMDADTMALGNIDELFDREELSAAPDAGWPDCFNSGVFVFRPSLETYQSLLQFAMSQGSFDGGDQGLLNLYFSDWATKDIAKHLPFIYNVVSQAFYSYLPAFRQFGKNVKVVHFIGAMKPWHHSFNTASGQVEPSTDTLHSMDFLQKWWTIFMAKVQPDLDPSSEADQVKDEMGILRINQANLVHIFEYHPPVVEYHPPPPPSPPQTLPFEEPTYQITRHYTPPDVPLYYEPFSKNDGVEVEPFENKDSRAYVFYESFYAEPPMTQEENYPSTEEAYQAQHFTDTWHEFNNPVQEAAGEVVAEPEPRHIPIGQPESFHAEDGDKRIQCHPGTGEAECVHTADNTSHSEDGGQDSQCHLGMEGAESVHTAYDITKEETEAVGSINTTCTADGSTFKSSADSHSSEHKHDNKVEVNISETKTSDTGQATESSMEHADTVSSDSHKEEEPNNNTETGKNGSKSDQINVLGVVEKMGNLTITSSGGMYSQEQLEDENRRFAWDRGQIDYLGIDSFELIQAKLQETIGKKPSPPPAENVVHQPKSILKKHDKHAEDKDVGKHAKK